MKSITSQIPVGTRFKMRFDFDDSPERRYSIIQTNTMIIICLLDVSRLIDYIVASQRFSGVVTGVGDLDPYRWPNSKWRCLMVDYYFIFTHLLLFSSTFVTSLK